MTGNHGFQGLAPVAAASAPVPQRVGVCLVRDSLVVPARYFQPSLEKQPGQRRAFQSAHSAGTRAEDDLLATAGYEAH